MLWKSNAQLAPGREGESDGIEHAREPRRVQVALDERLVAEPAMGAAVKALRQLLPGVCPAGVAILGEFGVIGGDFTQLGGASSCNHALDGFYKAPRGTKPHTSAKAALPALVADLFNAQIIPQAEDLIGQFSMQAATMGRELAFRGGQPTARLLVPSTLVPYVSALAAAWCTDAALPFSGTMATVDGPRSSPTTPCP
jgi:hypothetical protein